MGRVIMPGDPPLKMPEVYDEDCQWDSMHLKACALYEKSRYSEAEELFRQEYEGRRADSFPSWEKRYKCVNKLARTLGAQRKYDEALELFRQDNRPLTRKEGRHVGNRIPGEQHIDLLSLRHPLTCPLNNDGDFPNWVPGIEFSIDAYVSAAKNCVECRIYVAAVNTIHRGWISSTKKDKRNMSQYLQIYDSRILPGSQGYILLRPIYKGEKNVDVGIIEIRYDVQDENSKWSAGANNLPLSNFDWEHTEFLLKECDGHHTICHIPDSGYVPKRLVQVVGDGSNLRLVERQSDILPEGAKYCALSYCWGDQADTLTTRKENVAQHLVSIPISTLPQTIQDAVTVCRSLAIPYLWVDALCIIQNDDEERDWYEQSGEMCDIYSNARLVISADVSPSNNHGFLHGAGGVNREWKPLLVSHPDNPEQNTTVLVRELNADAYGEQASAVLSLQPLQRRGWALQESLLANRLLRFTSHGMRWECNTTYKDQLGFFSRAIRLAKLTRLYPEMHLKLPKSQLKEIYWEEEGKISNHITDYMNENTPTSIYHAWQGIVSHYTNRDLTNADDKLSALSGLARLISEALPTKPEDYLAGHWRDNLPSSLLWYVVEARTPNRPHAYRAPNWSWASVNGQIKYFQEQYQFHYASSITILSAHCEPSPLDPFGRVRSGRLDVIGLVVPITIRLSSAKPKKPRYSGNGGCAGYPFSDQFAWVTSLCGEAESRYETLQSNESTETIKADKPYVANEAFSQSEETLLQEDSNSILDYADPIPSYEVLLDDRISAESLASANLSCLLVGRHLDSKTGGSRVWWLVLKQAKQTVTDEEFWQRIGIGYFHEHRETFLELFDEDSARERMITLI